MIRPAQPVPAPRETEEARGKNPGPIAYLVKMFPRLSETFVTNELVELRRRGVDVRIVSLMLPTGTVPSDDAIGLRRETFYLPQTGERDGVRAIARDHLAILRRSPGRYLHALFVVARRFSRPAWKRFFQAGPVACFCLTEKVSHIHAGFAHVPTSVAWWTSRLTGIPFSFAAHAKDLYLSDRRSLRHKVDAARFVWTCTEGNGAYLRSLGSATPIHVGYHGSNLDTLVPAREPASRPASVPTILAVGRHVPKKGFDDLLRAAAILHDRRTPFRLVFIGDGPQRPALENLAASLGLNGSVEFLGSLSPREVRRAYARADLLTLPSVILENGDRDGIPNVLVEAMAMGLPVVSTRVSSIPELVRDGETGLLVSPRQPEELARAIGETITDRMGARRRAEAARRDVEERFDLHRNSERLADLLQKHRVATRCLYVSADLGVPIRGHKGASAHVRQIASRLAEAGLSVRIVTPAPGPSGEEGNRFDLPIEEVPPPSWTTRLLERSRGRRIEQAVKELRRLLHNFPLGRRVQGLLREVRPDFVYERYALCAIATGLACRRRRIPWLLEVNAPLADEEATFRVLRWRWLTRLLERWVLRHADHLFVVTHSLRRWALELGVRPERVSVLPNGVDGERFHPGVDGDSARREWRWTSGERIVAFSGSLKPWHGGLRLLEAFEQARRRLPELRLVYIGDGPERKQIEKRVRRLKLEPFVRFTGAVAQDRVPVLLRGADLLVAPYLPQGRFYFSPMKILEYMAVGRPVVAARIGEIPDLVDPSIGRLFTPGDRRDLTDAIVELAEDPDLCSRMGRAAAARAKSEDWRSRVETILGTVRSIRQGTDREPNRVGYVLKMFPRFSETFVVNEIVELERQGLEIRLFSMKIPSGRRQEGADRVWAAVTILQGGGLRDRGRAAAAHGRCFFRSPRRYLSTLGFALGRWDRRALVKFHQAGIVADACRRERIGHLHAHFASGPARVAKMASMLTGLPFSFTAHAKDLYWQGHRHGESHKLKKRVKLARFVVTVSRENERFIESLGFRVKEGRIRPTYIGLPLEEFPFRPPSARPRTPRPLILGVGRLIEKKGFHVLIDALAILRRRGLRFRCVLAGEGPDRDVLEEQIRRQGLDGAVRLVGAVPLTRLRRRYYARARILAQPCVVAADGDRDGIPTVLLEAMALGVPVVSTRVSGIPEAIDDRVDGLLTEPGEIGDLADRIETLLRDPELSERLAVAARARIERQFDLRRNAGSLRKLFLRSLQGWPPSPSPGAPATEPAEGREGPIAIENRQAAASAEVRV